MKKAILSVMLSVLMVATMLPSVSFAGVDIDNVAKNVETGEEYGTVQAAINAAANGQTVQMIADSTENVTVGTSTDRSKIVTLDLNGKTLKSTGTTKEDWYTNAITNYATITISDSSAGKSGTITGGKGTSVGIGRYGGGIYNTGGTLTITGGIITGNDATMGGGVANVNSVGNTGAFIMTGGTITGNTAGGGVYNDGTFTMRGGTITGNTASGYSVKGQKNNGEGGGIYNKGTFTMTGGTILGNYVKDGIEGTTPNGGGVFNEGTMKVSGTAKITGNTKVAEETSTTNNVYLPSGKTITVGTGSGADVKYLENGASIGVTTADTPTKGNPVNITGANGTNDYSAYFTSDNAAYDVVENGTKTELVVASGIPVAKITKGGVTKKFDTVQKAINFASEGDTVVMIADSMENVTVASGTNITLDLNGHVLSAPSTGGSVIKNEGMLTVTDTATSGNIHYFKVNGDGIWVLDDTLDTAYYTFDAVNGLKTVSDDKASTDIPTENKVIKVTGGCITGGKGTKTGAEGEPEAEAEGLHGGGVFSSGTLELTGGNIVGNSAVNYLGDSGGGVWCSDEIAVRGGAIVGNKSKIGAGVFVSGNTFDISGGRISYNTASVLAGGVNAMNGVLTGGEISRNTASQFGGAYFPTGCTVGGSAKVIQNTQTEDNSVSNTIVLDAALLSIATESGDIPNSDMSVGVSLINELVKLHDGQFTTNGASTDTKYFFSDSDEYIVKFVKGDAQQTDDAKKVDHLELAEKTVCKIGTKEYASIDAALKHGGTDASVKDSGESDTDSTKIVMIDDDTESVSIPAGRNITLDLNGHVLKAKSSSSVITNNGTLTIKDSNNDNKTHNFKVDSKGLWTLTDETATVNYEGLTARPVADTVVTLKGGCITGGNFSAVKCAGIVNNKNATLIIAGGNIVGNWNTYKTGAGIYSGESTTLTITGGIICGNAEGISTSGYGAGVAFYGSNFTFSGGEISFNSAPCCGGGIYVESGNFTMSDTAKVRYNKVSYSGGGIYTSSNYVKLLGGEIAGNSADGTLSGVSGGTGGGVEAMYGITLGGNVRIIDNKLAGKENNVYMANGKYITIADAPNAPASGTKGMNVGVTMANQNGGQFTLNGATTDTQYFFSDSDEYVVKFIKADTTKESTDPLFNDHLELAKAYTVTEGTCTNGSVSVGTTKKYAEGVEVTITNTPDNGYELDAYSVYKTGDETTKVTVNDGKFTMPEYNVTVSATFKQKATPTPPAPTPTPEEPTPTPEDPTPETLAKDLFIASGTAKGSTNAIKWNAFEGADGYDVYFAHCGEAYKKVKSTTALKYTKTGLNTKKVYKFKVKAYKLVDGKKTYLATTATIHIAGTASKYSNATKISVNSTDLSLASGETAKLGAKIAKKSNAKAVLWKNHVSAKVRYMSSDKSVATVDKNGKVKAVGNGEAYVYAYAANGVYAKVKISVTGDLGAVWIG